MKNIGNKTHKAIGEKRIKRDPLRLSIREGKFEGKTGLGTSFTLEVVPKKEFELVRQKKSKRNPQKKSLLILSDGKMKFEFAYYKNSNHFYGFYQGGVHRGSIKMSADDMEQFITNLLNIYIVYYDFSKGLKRLRFLGLIERLKHILENRNG